MDNEKEPPSDKAHNEISFSHQDWIRLRDSWNAICSTRKALSDNLAAIDRCVEESMSFRHYASSIQNKRIYLQFLQERIRQARRRLRSSQVRLGLVIDEECEHEKKKNVLIQKMASDQKELTKLDQDIVQLRQTHSSVRNELIFRRRFMIFELYKIFFFSNRQDAMGGDKRRCNCFKFDAIRGLHLPQVKARLGHLDAEIFAASGMVVLLLDNLGQILNFSLKHVLYFYGSRSFIKTKYNYEVLPLFNPSLRKLKDRLDKALTQLDDVVVSMRTDAGIFTPERDRPINNLRDFLLACLGQTTVEFIRLPVNGASELCLLLKTDANDSAANAENVHHPTVEFVERMSKSLSLYIPETREDSVKNSVSVLDIISPKKF